MSYDNGGGQYISGHSHGRRGGGSRNSGNGGSDYDDVKHCRNFADCGGYVWYKYSCKNEPNYCDQCKERFKETRQAGEALRKGGGIHHRRAFSDYGPPPEDTGETHTTIHQGKQRTSWDTKGGKKSGKHSSKQ